MHYNDTNIALYAPGIRFTIVYCWKITKATGAVIDDINLIAGQDNYIGNKGLAGNAKYGE